MNDVVNDFACFEGDTSDIPVDIRRLAVRLKKGTTIDYRNNDEFDALVDHEAEVRKCLNADFLDLYIDVENRVAWAEEIDGENSFLKRPGLQANNVSFFLAAASTLLERRQDGHELPSEWITTKTSLKEKFTKANAKLESDGRGSVSTAFDAAYRAADSRQRLRVKVTAGEGDNAEIINSAASMNGGRREKVKAFVLSAALFYTLKSSADERPLFAPILFDEAFIKSDMDTTQTAIKAMLGFGFQLFISCPDGKQAAILPMTDMAWFVTRADEMSPACLNPVRRVKALVEE